MVLCVVAGESGLHTGAKRQPAIGILYIQNIRVRVGTAYDIQGRTRSRTLSQGRRCFPRRRQRRRQLDAAETSLGGIYTIKYDKSLQRCENSIGYYFESEGNDKFYLFAL